MMNQPSRREAIPAFGGVLGAGLGAAAPLRGQSSELHLTVGSLEAGKPIRIGQIGTGHAHSTKLAVYRNSPDYEVIGVVEPDEALRKQAESKPAFQGVKWLTREELFATRDLRAVLVETKVQNLLGQAEACVDQGFSVHIDKPAGDSLPQFKRILEKAASKKLLVQMGYMYRYNPGVVLLKEFLKNGWLGEIFEVHAVMSKVVDPTDRKGFARFPGGMMFELGCHILDLVIGVMGKPQKVTPYGRHSSALADELKDNMLAVLEYPRAIATVKTSALEVEGFERRHLVVCGTGGTFQIQPLDDPKVKLSLSRDQGPYKKGAQLVNLPKYTRYVDDAREMARILRGEKATDFPYSHDWNVQETLMKACGLG